MAKRKRNAVALDPPAAEAPSRTKKLKETPAAQAKTPQATNGRAKAKPAMGKPAVVMPATTTTTAMAKATTVQIIVGSYEKVLHGITATIPSTISHNTREPVDFADSFAMIAHLSAIKCLAISPPSAPIPKQYQKVILASGSTDQAINLYHLSAHAPDKRTSIALPSLSGAKVLQNPQNRELGSLHQHASSITCLSFPSRSKLLSSSEDSTIAVTRTRDWQTISTIKAPIPKPVGRPSGDTAPLGGTPAGVNDFAVHPSMKLMISVGRGERCMRLWNLLTGKKAGVLTFDRRMLSEAGEGKYASGEARKVAWGATESGEEFCVGFDRGALVFGMDSQPRCKVITSTKCKIHQVMYVAPNKDQEASLLAVSAEDGRVLFFSTKADHLTTEAASKENPDPLPFAKLVAQIGGKAIVQDILEREENSSEDAVRKVLLRIKDFKVLRLDSGELSVVTANSEGVIRLWSLSPQDLMIDVGKEAGEEVRQVGTWLGAYETGNRITCLEAFVMLPMPGGDVATGPGDEAVVGEEDSGFESE